MNVQGFNPPMNAPMQAQSASSSSTSATSSSSNVNDPTSASGLQDTFINLLVTELQNQDPTQPVDPTEMVSQMVSLNQLDQLISINQILSTLATTPSSTTPITSTTPSKGNSGNGDPGYGTSNMPSGAAAPSKTAASPAAAFSQQLPAYQGAPNPAALMNLYGNIGVPANYSNNFTAAGGR